MPKPSALANQPPRSPEQAAEEDRRRFSALFKTILNRRPDEDTIQHHLELLKHQSWADICLALAESEEAQRRGPSTTVKPGSILILVITRDLNAGVQKIADFLEPLLRDGDHVTIINRSGVAPTCWELPRSSVLEKPGATVFECRAELSHLGRDYEWIALIEDHNIPAEDWMAAAQAAIAATSPETSFLSGAVDNRQSVDFWSWCSYLTTFSKHRPPMRAASALPGIANVLIRSANLPPGPYRPGQFEIEILPALASNGQPAPGLVVDHVQHVTMESALQMQANNARVIGALSRRYVDEPFVHLSAIEPSFTEQRALDIEQVSQHHSTPYPLKSVMDGVRLLLKSSFVAYSMGIIGGPGPDAYNVD